MRGRGTTNDARVWDLSNPRGETHRVRDKRRSAAWAKRVVCVMVVGTAWWAFDLDFGLSLDVALALASTDVSK